MLNSSYILIGLKVSSIKIKAMLKSVTLICTYVLCCSALFAQQMAAQAQFEQMRRSALPMGAESGEMDRAPDHRSGPYL